MIPNFWATPYESGRRNLNYVLKCKHIFLIVTITQVSYFFLLVDFSNRFSVNTRPFWNTSSLAFSGRLFLQIAASRAQHPQYRQQHSSAFHALHRDIIYERSRKQSAFLNDKGFANWQRGIGPAYTRYTTYPRI